MLPLVDYLPLTFYLRREDRKLGGEDVKVLGFVFAVAVQMAEHLPVVIQELGCSTYDESTKERLQDAWPEHAFPETCYDTDTSGEEVQRRFVQEAMLLWDHWRLRIPLILWFTTFEQHVEGDGCSIHPAWRPLLAQLHTADDSNVYPDPASFSKCVPCTNGASCHLCSLGEIPKLTFSEPRVPNARSASSAAAG